jgi:hypothetical protein
MVHVKVVKLGMYPTVFEIATFTNSKADGGQWGSGSEEVVNGFVRRVRVLLRQY